MMHFERWNIQWRRVGSGAVPIFWTRTAPGSADRFLRQLLQNSSQDASGNPVAITEVNAVKFQVSGKLVQTSDTGLAFATVPYYPSTPNVQKDRWYLPVNSSDTSKDYTVRLANGEMVLQWEKHPNNLEMENNLPVEFLFQGWSTNSDAIPHGLLFEDPFPITLPLHIPIAVLPPCRTAW